MGPGNENAGRGEYFRTLLGRPATITTLVVGAALGLVLGAYVQGALGALIAPLAVMVIVVGVAF